jgi:hypothetical protein
MAPSRTCSWTAGGSSRTRARRRETQLTDLSKRRASSSWLMPCSRNAARSQPCSSCERASELRWLRSSNRASLSGKSQSVACTVSTLKRSRQRRRLKPSMTR